MNYASTVPVPRQVVLTSTALMAVLIGNKTFIDVFEEHYDLIGGPLPVCLYVSELAEALENERVKRGVVWDQIDFGRTLDASAYILADMFAKNPSGLIPAAELARGIIDGAIKGAIERARQEAAKAQPEADLEDYDTDDAEQETNEQVDV